MKKLAAICLIIVATIALLFVLGILSNNRLETPSCNFVPLKRGDISSQILGRGKIVPNRMVNVKSRKIGTIQEIFVKEGEPQTSETQGMGRKMHILNSRSTGMLVAHTAIFLEHINARLLGITYDGDDHRGRLQKVELVASQPLPAALLDGPFPAAFGLIVDRLLLFLAGDDDELPRLGVQGRWRPCPRSQDALDGRLVDGFIEKLPAAGARFDG